MGAGLAARKERGFGGFDGDELDPRVVAAQRAAGAGDRAARADAGDEVVDLAVGVLPDLFAGRLLVDGGVRLVRKLRGEDGAVRRGHDLLRFVDGAAHSQRGFGQNKLRPESAQQRAPLFGHGGGHRENDFVPAGGSDPGEPDSRVAGGSLDDRPSLGELARGDCGVDDGDRDAVLHRIRRIVEFELREDGRVGAVGESVDADEGRAANEFRCVGEDF